MLGKTKPQRRTARLCILQGSGRAVEGSEGDAQLPAAHCVGTLWHQQFHRALQWVSAQAVLFMKGGNCQNEWNQFTERGTTQWQNPGTCNPSPHYTELKRAAGISSQRAPRQDLKRANH